MVRVVKSPLKKSSEEEPHEQPVPEVTEDCEYDEPEGATEVPHFSEKPSASATKDEFVKIEMIVVSRKKESRRNRRRQLTKPHLTETKYQAYRSLPYDDDSFINKKLPKELVLRIFSFLDVVTLCRCAQVCKTWNILALDGSNWQRVDLFEFQKDVEGPVVENLSKRCGGFLKSLSLRGCQVITDHAMGIFAEQCRNIEALNLNNCKKLTDVTCQSLGQYSHRLRKLDVSSCPNLTNDALRAISDGCPHLEHIDISWCVIMSDEAINNLSRSCHRITVFICRGLDVSDDGIEQLAVNCPNLKKLNVQGCHKLGDDAVMSVSTHCRNLLSLCLSNCPRITDNALQSLGTGCHELRTLEVSGCSHLTDSGFQYLIRNCPELQKMDLEECIQITDTTLAYLASHCHHLSALTLSHCELITDEGIRHIGSSPNAPESLTVLELDNCPLVTDTSLEHLVHCSSLQRIELYDCQLITRPGIRRLRNRLPNLKVHAYFAPVTPPPSVGGGRRRYCKCCTIL